MAMMTYLDQIIAYEQGDLDSKEIIDLFQHLVDTGLVWKLQGNYGRKAIDLMRAGVILPATEEF